MTQHPPPADSAKTVASDSAKTVASDSAKTVASDSAPHLAPARLALEGITKRFGDVVANDGVTLAVAPGEIHALVGENGAGKSTLVKIIQGVLRPDAGTMRWDGAPWQPRGPAAARARGIGMVFQHFCLFESLTVAENLRLALPQDPGAAALVARVTALSDCYGLAIDPGRRILDLSVGERQRVEILRCLLQAPRLLILDEPTSVLTPQEAERLFATLRRLAAEGVSILYISHKLEEIRRLCHRATVLRAGRVVGTCDPASTDSAALARLMLGCDPAPVGKRPPPQAAGAPLLVVDHLSMAAEDPQGVDLADLSLAVAGGEILGIAGIAGNGQATLMAALSGEHLAARGEAIRLDGVAIGHLGPAARRALGLAVVPEERLGRGAVPDQSLADNALLSSYRTHGLVRAGLVDRAGTRSLAERIIDRFGVRTHGPQAAARSLSGGNLQKFIIGREILQRPRLLIAGQPTWGVDAGAAAMIHRALLALRDGGTALVLISQDLDELFALADRIAVLCAGRLSPSRPAHAVTLEEVGLMMGGLFDGTIPRPRP